MQDNFNQGQDAQPYVTKPDNNLLWAILCTICCCLPFGIVSIIYAAKVNGLWAGQQYDAAIEAANNAKKWAIIGAVTGIVINICYAIWNFFWGGAALLLGMQ